MVALLPVDRLRAIQEQVRCRQTQVQQLAIFYNDHLPSPPILVATGLEHTGKLGAIKAVLQGTSIDHVIVKSKECLSQRHLLSKILAACIRTLGRADDLDRFDRLNSLNALVINLQKLFATRLERRFVLVIDGIDKQRGASSTLLSTLARLGDEITGLSVLLTSSSPRPLPLHRSGIASVHFPPYSRQEMIHVLTAEPPRLRPASVPSDFPSVSDDVLLSIYTLFAIAVYDTLGTHASAISLPLCRRCCERLWPRFVWPMLSGEPVPGRTLTPTHKVEWDFPRLLVRNRALFQVDGERALMEHLIRREAWTFEQLITNHTLSSSPSRTAQDVDWQIPVLKFFSTLLLVASYLASHGPAKHDIILFSRLSSSSAHKRRYLSSTLNKDRVRKTPTKRTPKKIGFPTGVDDTPSKANVGGGVDGNTEDGTMLTAVASAAKPGKEKTHKSSRLLFEKTSSIPRPFCLERVIAILRAIHPDGLSRSKVAADRVYAEMVELERLRLVVRLGTGANAGTAASSGGTTSAGGGGGGGGRSTDDGILEEKWRVNVSREMVVEMGTRWQLSLEGCEID